ncbi:MULTISPECIES: hypothetical protein [unclassified Bradyrhizobium]
MPLDAKLVSSLASSADGLLKGDQQAEDRSRHSEEGSKIVNAVHDWSICSGLAEEIEFRPSVPQWAFPNAMRRKIG